MSTLLISVISMARIRSGARGDLEYLLEGIDLIIDNDTVGLGHLSAWRRPVLLLMPDATRSAPIGSPLANSAATSANFPQIDIAEFPVMKLPKAYGPLR